MDSLALFKDLMLMAVSDGHLNEQELRMLAARAVRWGITDAVQGLPGGASRNSIGVVYQDIIATLYGVTATGFVVFLWPLAHLKIPIFSI